MLSDISFSFSFSFSSLLFSLETADTCYFKLGATDTSLTPDFILPQVALSVTGSVLMSSISSAMNGPPRLSFSLHCRSLL